MIIIFEGCRNSGKTFLSKQISEDLYIPRFQFDFVEYFNGLNLESKESEPAHSFSMGKDLMLMQLNRDGFIQEDVIIDRGFLTVLSWGLLEKRIDLPTARKHLGLLNSNGLTRNIHIVYVEGDNPDTSDRNKDMWDGIEKTKSEKVAYEFILHQISSDHPDIKITRFRNEFNEQSIHDLAKIIKNVRNNTSN
jgi:hypothetical protein